MPTRVIRTIAIAGALIGGFYLLATVGMQLILPADEISETTGLLDALQLGLGGSPVARAVVTALGIGVNEERYRQLTEGCLDAIVVTDQAGRITLFNPAAERAFGYASEQVLGRTFAELLADEARPAFTRELEAYVATRGGSLVGQTVELSGRRAGGAT